MATTTLNVLLDRFKSLSVAPNAWLLYLPTADNIQKGDTLLVRLVDSLGNYLGQYRTGICAKTSTEQFIVYAKGTQCYYFTNLSTPMQIYTSALFKQTVPVSHTGSTAEFILKSWLIPAGTMQANDVLRVTSHFSTLGTASTKSLRYRINTVNSLAGVVNVAINTVASAVTDMTPFVRNIVFNNSLSAQTIITPSNSVLNDESIASNAANGALTFNFAIDQYFIISGMVNNAGDTITLLDAYGIIIR